MERVVAWFSCGAASAVATKLTLAKYGPERTVIAYTETRSEHPDSERFLTECQAWFGHPIERLGSTDYHDVWDVWERRRMIVLHHGGAPCTGEMKRAPRFAFQRPTDIQVFGYTVEERKRAANFRETNFEINVETPLIDSGLTKGDCLGMLDRAGIEIPVMYRLGFRNNNCLGCPKGGMGYWNMIRQHFPETFDRMAALERRLGMSIFNGLYLDELAPDRGDIRTEPEIECSLMCHLAEQDMAA
jgi:hypothetical protein